MFELGDLDAPPGLRGSDQSRVHELEDGALAEDDAGGSASSALLAEQALEEVGRPDPATVRSRALEVCDAGLEVLLETDHCGRVVAIEPRDEVVPQHSGHRYRGSLVRGPSGVLELALGRLRDLVHDVAHLVSEAPLPQRVGEDLLDGLDDSGSSIRDDEDRIAQTPPLEVVEELDAALVGLLRPGRQVNQALAALDVDAPRNENRLPPRTWAETLVEPVQDR